MASVNEIDPTSNKVYPLTVIFPLLAFFSTIACTPPFLWHIRNRHTGAAALTFWLLFLNFTGFVNALAWPTDDINNWPSGVGYCDIYVHFSVAGSGGIPAAMLCIMRDLARALDTNRPRGESDAQKRRKLLVDLALCIGIPLYILAVYFVVQPGRYYLFAIQGCWPVIDDSWLSIVLIVMWPPLLSIVSGYYASLILIRMHRHGRDIARILNSASTTRSRFLRLFVVALLMLLCFLPYQIWTVWYMLPGLHPFNWANTHRNWDTVVKVPTGGQVTRWGSWVWIVCGFAVFALFGLSHDAKDMYKGWMEKTGVGKIFPSPVEVNPHNDTPSDDAMDAGSWSNLLFKKVGFRNSTWWASSANTSHGRDSVLRTVDTRGDEMTDVDDKRKSKYSLREIFIGPWSSSNNTKIVTAGNKDLEAGLAAESMN